MHLLRGLKFTGNIWGHAQKQNTYLSKTSHPGPYAFREKFNQISLFLKE